MELILALAFAILFMSMVTFLVAIPWKIIERIYYSPLFKWVAERTRRRIILVVLFAALIIFMVRFLLALIS
jgi:hypothetical protein